MFVCLFWRAGSRLGDRWLLLLYLGGFGSTAETIHLFFVKLWSFLVMLHGRLYLLKCIYLPQQQEKYTRKCWEPGKPFLGKYLFFLFVSASSIISSNPVQVFLVKRLHLSTSTRHNSRLSACQLTELLFSSEPPDISANFFFFFCPVRDKDLTKLQRWLWKSPSASEVIKQTHFWLWVVIVGWKKNNVSLKKKEYFYTNTVNQIV